MSYNAWITFLKRNKNKYKNIQLLSFVWKNKQAKLVTLHIDFVRQLHNEIQTLKQTCQDLEMQNNYLLAVVHYIDCHCEL
jgi:hypothetical protein